MQIHEIINDDLSIHYLFQVSPEDMQAIKVMAQHADTAMDGLDLGHYKHAALIATILANYPITTYQEKMDAIPPLKKAD